MRNIIVNESAEQMIEKKNNKTFWKKLNKTWNEVAEIMVPGMCAMNNTYYRPVK